MIKHCWHKNYFFVSFLQRHDIETIFSEYLMYRPMLPYKQNVYLKNTILNFEVMSTSSRNCPNAMKRVCMKHMESKKVKRTKRFLLLRYLTSTMDYKRNARVFLNIFSNRPPGESTKNLDRPYFFFTCPEIV